MMLKTRIRIRDMEDAKRISSPLYTAYCLLKLPSRIHHRKGMGRMTSSRNKHPEEAHSPRGNLESHPIQLMNLGLNPHLPNTQVY